MKEYYLSHTITTNLVAEQPAEYGYICSPLNYIGGKYKLLSQIIPLFPVNINRFVDLFCGGCNVGINTPAKSILFNDNLKYLIDLYICFQKNEIKDVLAHIENRIKEYSLTLTNETGYLELRKLYNTERNPLDLFVLIAYSFNHQIRFNNSHNFNNPFGRERSSYNPKMRQKLQHFLKRIKSKEISFSSMDFLQFDFSQLSTDDFVYCDPPYLITTGTYNDGKRGFKGWSNKEEEQLLSLLSILNNKGVKFALSNVLTHKDKTNNILTNWIKKNDMFVTHLNMDYSNSYYNKKDKSRYSSDEVLITNYQPVVANNLFNINEIYR